MACPCCSSELQPLLANISQPLMGYIPTDIPLYFRCVKCKLIVLSPYTHPDDVEKLYDFYYLENQGTNYLVKRKARYKHYDVGIAMVENHLPQHANCLELGSGYGAFLYYLKDRKPLWKSIGCDLKEVIEFHRFKERKEIDVINIDFLKDDLGTNKYDLISCWEVIEHMPFSHFKMFMDKVYKALKPNGIFLFSTPDFDSPLCQMFDFWAVMPLWHPLVFSKFWMNNYFGDNDKFRILKIENESTLLETYENWFGYWKTTSRYYESKKAAEFILGLLNDPGAKKEFEKVVKKNEWGVEMIVALQKIDGEEHS